MTGAKGELLTVGRALDVLASFTEDRPTWGVTELAVEHGLDKAQVHRILTTLTRHGFTVAEPHSRRYALGVALVGLGRLAERGPGLRGQLEAHLEELTARTGQSTVVCVPDGLTYRTIAACEGPALLRYNTEVGRSYPGHLGATGHAIFAFHTFVGARDLLAADGGRPTAAEVAALERRHEQTRADGHSVSAGEYDPGAGSVSAPLTIKNRVFASISVLGPKESITERATDLVAAVLDTARKVESTLDT